MQYQINSEDGLSNLALFLDGKLYAVNSTHPYWQQIIESLHEGYADEIPELIDLAEAARVRFAQVTERVTVDNGSVYFDGDVVHNSLADAIIRAMDQDTDFTGLALFMDKCYQNPRKHSRDNLFDWLNTHSFTITEQGDLVAYKGVKDNLTSCSSGPGIVNGVKVDGHLDNSVGNVVEIARSYVEHDPGRGCSQGLHVGTWDYASNFGSKTLKVIVNPRDVVSVPTDCDFAKMRVCRYKVAALAEAKVETLSDPSWDDDWDSSNW